MSFRHDCFARRSGTAREPLFLLVGAAITIPMVFGYTLYANSVPATDNAEMWRRLAWFVGLWVLGVSPVAALLKSALSAATH